MPPITLVLLVIALFFFATGKIKQLAYLASISIIFQQAHIVTGITNITPERLILFLLIILTLVTMILSSNQNIDFSKKYDKPLVFAIYIIPASILASIMAAGSLVTPIHKIAFGTAVQEAIDNLVPLEPSSALITQNLFVIFPIIGFYCLRRLSKETLQNCVNYFVYAVAFLSIWNIITALEFLIAGRSVLQLVTYYLIGQQGGYSGTHALGFIRVGGFVGEPSLYTYVTLPAFGYVMGMAMIDKRHRNKWYKFALLFTIGLIFSFSTSAFIGILLFMGIYSLYNFGEKSFLRFAFFLVVILAVGVFMFRDLFGAYFQYNIAKTVSGQGSFAIRIWSIKYNLMLFLKHPFLGIGIGSTGALGGIATLLTCIGIFGISFLVYSFRWLFPIHSKGILFSVYALIIYNIITGDLSSVFSPIFAILFAYSSKKDFGVRFNYA